MRLGGVHRLVCSVHQGDGGATVAGMEGDAHAHRHPGKMRAQLVGAGKLGEQSVGKPVGSLQVAQLGENDGELVSPESCD
ncbi:hypothetical protein RZS08_34820, partial [Arthrospira platensis SPKY1]|nr:hypothetical protein [Arthrospira platensis SPKY1]